MKLRTILLPALAVIAVVLFCVVTASLTSVTLYEAKEDAFSAEHIDPSIKTLMTTEESKTIFPLMEDMMVSCRDTVFELSEGDIEYFKRELSSYANLLNRFGTNINKLQLSKTDLETFRLAADDVHIAMEILGDDYERVLELLETRNTASADERAVIDNQLRLIAAEAAGTIPAFTEAAEIMMEIAEKYSLDTTALKEVFAVLNPQNIDINDILSRLPIGHGGYSASTLSYIIEPVSGVYGDIISVTGRTVAKSEITIYWDSTIWKNIVSDAAGNFAAKLRIEKIPAGERAVTLASGKALSKSTTLTVIPLNSEISIISASQEEIDGERVVTIRGELKTERDVPVSDAPVSVIADEYGYIFAKGSTNGNGIWEASAAVTEGAYRVYAEFNDRRFPLFSSRSEVIELTIDPIFGVRIINADGGNNQDAGGYYLILLLLAAVLGFIIWRIIRRRNQSKKAVSVPKQSAEKTSAETIRLEDAADAEDERIEITEEELKEAEKASQNEGVKPLPLFPAGISAAESIREIYCCVIHTLAKEYGIEYIDAKTPREICAAFSSASKELVSFMNTYEYFRYSGVTVTEEHITALKDAAVIIPELSHPIKPSQEAAA
ncbi:MAG: hypothetical protein MJ116_08035 [Lachnospiraceae bacterium]|nr:hypothetical protein [Lachnospiraceae bacterium]